MSHAALLEALDTGGIWSASRGLARGVASYKAQLSNCDLPRRNDLDGRGVLSEEELARFTQFFLEVCIDQVGFMESLVQPDRLRARVLLWAEEEASLGRLAPKVGTVLEALLYRGQVPRAEVAGLLGTTDRHARRVIAPPCGTRSSRLRPCSRPAEARLSRRPRAPLDAGALPGGVRRSRFVEDRLL